MKKLILFALLITMCQATNAQEETTSSKFVLGGSMNFIVQNNTYPISTLSIGSGIGGIYSSNVNDVKNTRFSVTPYFGKEINPHLILGIQLDYQKGNYEAADAFTFSEPNPVDFERNSNQIGMGVFARYILNPDKKVNFYFQPYFEYNSLKEKELFDGSISQEEKATFIEMGVGLGVLYNINDKIRMTLRTGGLLFIDGKWEVLDSDIEKEFSSFSTNINLSTIFFGAEIRL